MDIRKVQMTGGSSFIITLPKDWVNRMGVEKNDSLGIIQQNDGTLLITPEASKRFERTKVINVDDIIDGAYLFRLLVGAYVMGFHQIQLRSSKRTSPMVRERIRDFTQTAMGFEVMEEDSREIVLKDLLNPEQMPFERTLGRMITLVSSMHRDAIRSFLKKDVDLAENIGFRDKDLDRLHWLISRQYSMMMEDVTMVGRMGVGRLESHIFYLLSRILERIGDHAVRISNVVPRLVNEELEAKTLDHISHLNEESMSLLEDIENGWKENDIRCINNIIAKLNGLHDRIAEVEWSSMKLDTETAISLNQITSSMKRTTDYSTDMCETLINNMMRSNGEVK